MESTKKIMVDMTPKKSKDELEEEKHQREEAKKSRVPKKRVITNHKKWEFSEEDLECSQQLIYIRELENENEKTTKQSRFIHDSIRQKISSYRSQDTLKERYSKEDFITKEGIVKLLRESNNICYYCQEPVKLLYEYVRDPKQWTLERINNSKGHNADNLTIACLGCNLGRRTMHQERYVFTKQLNIVKTNIE